MHNIDQSHLYGCIRSRYCADDAGSIHDDLYVFSSSHRFDGTVVEDEDVCSSIQ
jgi:hypothetical protein